MKTVVTMSGRKRLVLSQQDLNSRDLSRPFSDNDDMLTWKAKEAPDAESFVKSVMPYYKKYDDEKAFIEHHKTGFISPDAYEEYGTMEGLSWLGDVGRRPILVGTMTVDGERLEFRKSGEKLNYVKHENDDIARDEHGLAILMTDDEIEEKGFQKYDATIVVFNQNGQPIGLASDEFGSDGVWVADQYAGKGIGRVLLREFRKQFKSRGRIGQMTDAGESMSRAYYRDMEANAEKLRALWRSVH